MIISFIFLVLAVAGLVVPIALGEPVNHAIVWGAINASLISGIGARI